MLLKSSNSSHGKFVNGTRLIVVEVINGGLLKATIAGAYRVVIKPAILMSPIKGLFPLFRLVE